LVDFAHNVLQGARLFANIPAIGRAESARLTHRRQVLPAPQRGQRRISQLLVSRRRPRA